MAALCSGLRLRFLHSLCSSIKLSCELEMSSHGQRQREAEKMMWEKSGRLGTETAVFWVSGRAKREGFIHFMFSKPGRDDFDRFRRLSQK